MKTEVFINDLLIDLDDEATLVASYGNITFGELNKRKGIKSNIGQAPFSPRNKLAFESCELTGSWSLFPYRNNLFRVEISGVIVFEGFCIMDECKDGYGFQSFSGASDFYTIVNSRKLNTLNLSQYSHVWNDVNIRNSWNNVQGYIYAFVEYGQNWPSYSNFPGSYLLPQLFFHSVIKQIAIDAGYVLYGDVLTDPRFLKHVIIPNKFPVPILYGGTFNLSLLLPDLAQSKVWLDFANIYGLQFNINDVSKEIHCTYIDDILFNDPQDWSSKVDNSEKKSTRYKLGYGQISKLRFKSDPETEINGAYQDFAKDIAIDDTTLTKEADVYRSDFYLIQTSDLFVGDIQFPLGTPITMTFNSKGDLFYGFWRNNVDHIINSIAWLDGTFYRCILIPNLGQNPSTSLLHWEPVKPSDVWNIKLRPMYGTVMTVPNSTRIVEFATTTEPVMKIINNIDMDWGYTYQHHFRVFSRIIQRTKIVEKLLKLNYSDVNQLDFTRAKVVDNELYLLQEVKQFKLNQTDSTICELVRI